MSAVLNVVALVVPIALGLGAGWLGSGLLVPAAPHAPPSPEAAAEVALDDLPGPVAVVPLDPIVTNLADAAGAWARLELTAVFAAEPTREAAEAVHADALAILRATTLAQVSTPSGYLYLHADLAERARELTDGAVADVLVRTFLVE